MEMPNSGLNLAVNLQLATDPQSRAIWLMHGLQHCFSQRFQTVWKRGKWG